MSDTKGTQKVRELVEKVKVCMFVTQNEDGALHSRPMQTNEMDDAGNIWFFTNAFSDKVDEFRDHRPVNLAYAHRGDDDYVSVSGKAYLIRDRSKLEEKWNPILKAWFPDGLETEGIALVKVKPDTAEYWDAQDNKLIQGVKILKAIVTGTQHDSGDHGRVNMA